MTPSRSITVIASTAASMIARIFATFSLRAALRLGRGRDVAGDEDGARRRAVGVAQRPSSRLERDLVTVGVSSAKAHRRDLVDLEGLAQRRLDVGPVERVDDVETGVSPSTGLGVAVDLLALGAGLDDVEVAVDDDDGVGGRLEHRLGDRECSRSACTASLGGP